MRQSSVIATSTHRQPRENFGPRWNSRNDEELFARSFTSAYDKKFRCSHAGSPKTSRFFALEVPVQGLGIADMISMAWDGEEVTEFFKDSWNTERLLSLEPTIRAFEVKLFDWRKGLMQAYRYRFFADASILVMPDAKKHLIKPFLATFRQLNVGFWTFNGSTEVIDKVYTPRPQRPALTSQRRKAAATALATVTQDRRDL